MQPDARSAAEQRHTHDGEVADADRLFQEGLAHHREGRLLEAKGLYERAIKAQHGHFDATHLLGVIAYQLGDPLRARDLIAQAGIVLKEAFMPAATQPCANAGRKSLT